jgi:hypothetical protein
MGHILTRDDAKQFILAQGEAFMLCVRYPWMKPLSNSSTLFGRYCDCMLDVRTGLFGKKCYTHLFELTVFTPDDFPLFRIPSLVLSSCRQNCAC